MCSMSNFAAPITLSVHCNSIDEAKAAIMAIEALRTGTTRVSAEATPLPDATNDLAERIEAALGGAPLNPPKAIILKMLLNTPAGDWLPYPDMQKAFSEEGIAPERAAAALRDISWQMGEYMPPEHVGGLAKKIEIMAERTRAGGVYQYRLTRAGRIAVDRFLRKQS